MQILSPLVLPIVRPNAVAILEVFSREGTLRTVFHREEVHVYSVNGQTFSIIKRLR